MDIHNMRVVTFDSSLKEDTSGDFPNCLPENKYQNISIKGNVRKDTAPNRNHAEPNIDYISRSVSKYPNDNHNVNDRHKEKTVLPNKVPPESFRKVTRLDNERRPKVSEERKEANEIYKDSLRSIGRSLKKCKYRNTVSFENLMKSLSSKNYKCFTRIQNKLQHFHRQSNELPEKNSPMRKKHKESNDDVEVLYVCETVQTDSRIRITPNKHSNHCRKSNKRKVPVPVKSFSSRDVSSFCRNGRVRIPSPYYERPYCLNLCNSMVEFGKRLSKRKRCKENIPKKQSPKCPCQWGRSYESYRRERPMHLNVIDFPVPKKHRQSRTRIKLHNNQVRYRNRVNRSTFKDKGVLVALSRCQTPRTAKSTCDAVVTVNKSIQSCRCAHSCDHKDKKPIKPVKSCQSIPLCGKICHRKKSLPWYCGTRGILKYILGGLVALAWLPCVTLIGVVWLITYPLRPHHGECGKKASSTASCKRSDRRFWDPFINFANGIVKNTLYSFKAIGDMFKPTNTKKCQNSKNCARVHTSCCPKSHPNPNKKYTLYFAEKRGWMMKPIRNRWASVRRVCVMKIQNGIHKVCRQSCSQPGNAINVTPLEKNPCRETGMSPSVSASKAKIHIPSILQRKLRKSQGVKCNFCRKPLIGNKSCVCKPYTTRPIKTDHERTSCKHNLPPHCNPTNSPGHLPVNTACPRLRNTARGDKYHFWKQPSSVSYITTDSPKYLPVKTAYPRSLNTSPTKANECLPCKETSPPHPPPSTSPAYLPPKIASHLSRKKAPCTESHSRQNLDCHLCESKTASPCRTQSICPGSIPFKNASNKSRKIPQGDDHVLYEDHSSPYRGLSICPDSVPKISPECDPTKPATCHSAFCQSPHDLSKQPTTPYHTSATSPETASCHSASCQSPKAVSKIASAQVQKKTAGDVEQNPSLKKETTTHESPPIHYPRIKPDLKLVKQRIKQDTNQNRRRITRVKNPQFEITTVRHTQSKRKSKIHGKRSKKRQDEGRLKRSFRKFCEYFLPADENICNKHDGCFDCHDIYLQLLRNKPCFWVYKMCPSAYPFFLDWYRCTMNCCHMMFYVATICVWSPVLICCYSCYWLNACFCNNC